MMTFLHEHPELANLIWSCLVWPFVAGLLLLAFNRWVPKTGPDWETLMQSRPLLWWVWTVLKATGVDLPDLAQRAREKLRGPAPAIFRSKPPSPPGGA